MPNIQQQKITRHARGQGWRAETKERKQKRPKKSLQGISNSTPELSDNSSEVRVINKHKRIWEDGEFQERTGTQIMLILYM